MFDNGLLNGELFDHREIDAINSSLISVGELFEITQTEINSMKLLQLTKLDGCCRIL